MKSWIFGAITVACVSVTSLSLACPMGQGEAVRPTPRPSPVQNVSFQASEMMERATRLESAATSRELTARSLEQQADTLANRARILRNQAQLVNASDRASILDIADELSQRAASERVQAANDRAQAQELRIEAAGLRQRAIALVRLNNGGGGGWKGRVSSPSVAVPPPAATPLPSERSVTL